MVPEAGSESGNQYRRRVRLVFRLAPLAADSLLQTPCCGHVLWAYNSRHLSFLRRYVSADLREQLVVKNQSLANSLPTWIKTAKNRDAVLKGLDRLDALLLES